MDLRFKTSEQVTLYQMVFMVFPSRTTDANDYSLSSWMGGNKQGNPSIIVVPNGYLGGSVLLKEVRKVIEKSILAEARYSGS